MNTKYKYSTIINNPANGYQLLNEALNLGLRSNKSHYATDKFLLHLQDNNMYIWFESLIDEDFVISTVYRISRIVGSSVNLEFKNEYDDDVETNTFRLYPSPELEAALHSHVIYNYHSTIYIRNIQGVYKILNCKYNTDVFMPNNSGIYTDPQHRFQIKLDYNVIDIYVSSNNNDITCALTNQLKSYI